MSTVKQIRAFVAVAQSQSFTEACGIVHLSQPALSIAIKNLESDLGGALLVRTTRTLALTPEGEAFLPLAVRLLADWDAAIEDIHNRFSLRRGKIAIAAMPSFAANLLPKALVAFRERFPKINIAVNDVVAEQVVEMVQTGRVEIGICFDPGVGEDLAFTPMYEDNFIAIVPPLSPLAKKTKLTWKHIIKEPFITLQRPSSFRLALDQSFAEHNLTPAIAFETHQLATIGRMVANGLGVSVVPSLCREQMQEMGAICCQLTQPTIARKVGILTRRRYPLSKAALELKQVISAMVLK
ncbi:MAG: LysR family carnitine catabolism transcriptional activator [Lentisphaeria bacterium]|jgi:LysR family carnitine catabolism transcriptional activator